MIQEEIAREKEMNIKKIVGIEPSPPGFHVFSAFKLPRLGLPQMGTILKEKGYDVRIYCPDIAAINWDEVLSADMVMLSTITSTAPETYLLGKRYYNCHGRCSCHLHG